jgi:two-component system, sensor histidine kinase ChiS
MKHSISTILFTVLTIYSHSQVNNLFFNNISVRDKLPYDQMYYGIGQDHRGFIWLATDNGLHKFDGFEFTSYYHDPKDPASIPGKSVRAILSDSKNRLWFATTGGVCMYNEKLDNFKTVPYIYSDQMRYNCAARSITENDKGQILIGISFFGIYRFNEKEGVFNQVEIENPLLDHAVIGTLNTLLTCKKGNLWVATDQNGVFSIDIENQNITNYLEDNPMGSRLTSNTTYAMVEDGHSYIWVTTGHGLNRIDPVLETVKTYQNNPDDPHSISYDILWRVYEDPKGNLWLTTDGGGLNLYDRKRDRFIRFLHDPADPYSLSGNKTNVVFVDNQNNLWVNAIGKGLNHANLNASEKLTLLTHRILDKNSLSFNQVSSILEDRQGNIWIGTDGGGLNYYDRSNNRFKHYKANKKNPGTCIPIPF